MVQDRRDNRYRWREALERELAERSSDPQQRRLHAMMARLYAELGKPASETGKAPDDAAGLTTQGPEKPQE